MEIILNDKKTIVNCGIIIRVLFDAFKYRFLETRICSTSGETRHDYGNNIDKIYCQLLTIILSGKISQIVCE